MTKTDKEKASERNAEYRKRQIEIHGIVKVRILQDFRDQPRSRI